jgi:hypothetical protein
MAPDRRLIMIPGVGLILLIRFRYAHSHDFGCMRSAQWRIKFINRLPRGL